jgi:carboxymethylenebutenolidase
MLSAAWGRLRRSIPHMCFDLDSRPPIAPIAGAAVDGKLIHLHASDGTEFSAFHAVPATPSGAAIMILPDVRGLHPFFEELALRFAEAGVEAVSVDYFGRTAGLVTDGNRGDDFDFQSHVAQIEWGKLLLDMRAATELLHGQAGVRAVYSTGFCMGGRAAYDAGTRPELGMSGVIGFYGWPASGAGRGGMPSPTDLAAEFTCPVLGLFGGADQGIPQPVIDEFEAALNKAGVENEIVVYPNATHSFFDRKAAEFQDASTDAWRRTLDFMRDHTPQENVAAA